MKPNTLLKKIINRDSWKKLINQNACTRKKLWLYLNPRVSVKKYQNIDFRYNNLNAVDFAVWDEETVKMITKYGKDLRRLNLISCNLYQTTYVNIQSLPINDIFNCLEKLEYLFMARVAYYPSFIDFEPFKLNHLKKVIMNGSSLELLKYFQNSQLTNLDIRGVKGQVTKEKNELHLIEFLGTQKKLEELELFGLDFSDSIVTEEHIERMNFPLKRLSLNENTNFMSGESNALAFLERFSDTLEHLRLHNLVHRSFYALLFEKLQKLQSLHFFSRLFPRDENFYKTLPILGSVKKLAVHIYSDEDRQNVQGIIGNLPNVETLIIEGPIRGKSFMKFVSNNLLKLRSLGIDEFTGNLFQDVRMPQSLRKVEVLKLEDISDENWNQMLLAMPNVEQLTLCSTHNELNETKFDALTRSWTQLRVLNLDMYFEPKAQMFKDLISRCQKITTVRCRNYSNDPAFKDLKKPGLRLLDNRLVKFEYLYEEKDPMSLNYY